MKDAPAKIVKKFRTINQFTKCTIFNLIKKIEKFGNEKKT